MGKTVVSKAAMLILIVSSSAHLFCREEGQNWQKRSVRKPVPSPDRGLEDSETT